MTNVTTIKPQHLKKVGATNQTIDKRPNPFKEIDKMT
jgi:hypothetical protein